MRAKVVSPVWPYSPDGVRVVEAAKGAIVDASVGADDALIMDGIGSGHLEPLSDKEEKAEAEAEKSGKPAPAENKKAADPAENKKG